MDKQLPTPIRDKLRNLIDKRIKLDSNSVNCYDIGAHHVRQHIGGGSNGLNRPSSSGATLLQSNSGVSEHGSTSD